MDLLETIRDIAIEKAGDLKVTDLRIGLTYTAALLENGSSGLAYTFRKDIKGGCCCFQTSRPVAGSKASAIITLMTSGNILERTVGLATANAVLNHRRAELVEGDILEMIKPGRNDVIGMVGYFAPLVKRLQQRVKKIYIFENQPREAEEDLYPAEKAFEMLPSCSIAIITSTTLINRTVEPLLKAAQNCKKTALAGATTPLCRQAFKPLGISILSGLIITDPRAVLQTVSEAGGMKNFKGFIEKVNYPCNSQP